MFLNGEQYQAKVNDLLSDNETYEQLQRDPRSSYTRRVREALKSVKDKDNLSRG